MRVARENVIEVELVCTREPQNIDIHLQRKNTTAVKILPSTSMACFVCPHIKVLSVPEDVHVRACVVLCCLISILVCVVSDYWRSHRSRSLLSSENAVVVRIETYVRTLPVLPAWSQPVLPNMNACSVVLSCAGSHSDLRRTLHSRRSLLDTRNFSRRRMELLARGLKTWKSWERVSSNGSLCRHSTMPWYVTRAFCEGELNCFLINRTSLYQTAMELERLSRE